MPKVCHSLRGSVDWNVICQAICIRSTGHSLRGSVDWNKVNVIPPQAQYLSLPSWECWLKLMISQSQMISADVTPFVGVLIEIVELLMFVVWLVVTPFVGVLIERLTLIDTMDFESRHSLRGSVDWKINVDTSIINELRHSLRGSVDWKGLRPLSTSGGLPSLPSWECWLKAELCHKSQTGICHSLRGSVDWKRSRLLKLCDPWTSLPSWECWLKESRAQEINNRCLVTPFVGVLIERIFKVLFTL